MTREPMTLAEIALKEEISVARAGQILHGALDKLRRRYPVYCGMLRDLADELHRNDQHGPDFYDVDDYPEDVPEAA